MRRRFSRNVGHPRGELGIQVQITLVILIGNPRQDRRTVVRMAQPDGMANLVDDCGVVIVKGNRPGELAANHGDGNPLRDESNISGSIVTELRYLVE